MRTKFSLAFAVVIFCACSTSEKISYDKTTDEYVRAGKRQVLKAGRKQKLSITFSEPMGEVYGMLNGRRIQFEGVGPKDQQSTWKADFDVPKFHDLGPEKFLRVYATDLGGTPILGGTPDRFPGAWLRRGEDGEFPKVPAEDFERHEITE